MINLAEQLRAAQMKHISEIKSFQADWPARRAFLLSKLGPANGITRQKLLSLGNHLSEAFQLVGSADRSQGALSAAGTVWEALVVWYANLCLAGTHAICFRGGAFAPDAVKFALSVQHESTLLRSEPDVIIVSLAALDGESVQQSATKMHSRFGELASECFSEVGLINLQCKTNWNDNAQIPMLWNMLYNQARKGAVIPNGFTIGRKGFSLHGVGHFGYGFVTVPSQKPTEFEQNDLAVLRAKTMTAGNYWGHASKSGVALSISELFNFFNRNPRVFPAASTVGKAATEEIKSGSIRLFM